MMWHRSHLRLVILLLVGCAAEDVRVAGPTRVTPPPQHVVVAPHSGDVVMVAVTDDAGAALTVDDVDQLRLWPALDGTREPVVIEHGPVRQLALGRDGTTLIAVLVDLAGGADLIAFDDGGGIRHRAVLGAEPPIERVMPLGTGMLMMRRDETLVWLDANGAARGKLVPHDGERIVALATRAGAAAALIGDGAPTSTIMRRILVGDGLAWGESLTLPHPVIELALAPGHKRIATIDAKTHEPEIFEIATRARIAIAGARSHTAAIGFVDDHHLAIAGGNTLDWWSDPPQDPWAGAGRLGEITDDAVGIGNGRVIAAHRSSLAIVDPERTRYLGYLASGQGSIELAAAHATLHINEHIIWLDDKLHATRITGPEDERDPPLRALDDRWMLSLTMDSNTVQRAKLFVHDVGTHVYREIGAWPEYRQVEYEPASQVIVVATPLTTDRLQLDRGTGATTALRGLVLRQSAVVHPVDPKLAGGTVAVAMTPESPGLRIETYRDGAGTGPLHAATSVSVAGIALGVDRTGAAYVLNRNVGSYRVIVVRGSDTKTSIELPPREELSGGAVSADGTQFALIGPHEILAVDRAHGLRWSGVAWQPNTVTYDATGTVLYVVTQAGLVELDAATGHQLATGCGWGFGLYPIDRTSKGRFFGANVCSEAAP